MWNRLVKVWGARTLGGSLLICCRYLFLLSCCPRVSLGLFPSISRFRILCCLYDLEVRFSSWYIQVIPLPHDGVVRLARLFISPANCGVRVDAKPVIVFSFYAFRTVHSEQCQRVPLSSKFNCSIHAACSQLFLLQNWTLTFTQHVYRCS